MKCLRFRELSPSCQVSSPENESLKTLLFSTSYLVEYLLCSSCHPGIQYEWLMLRYLIMELRKISIGGSQQTTIWINCN